MVWQAIIRHELKKLEHFLSSSEPTKELKKGRKNEDMFLSSNFSYQSKNCLLRYWAQIKALGLKLLCMHRSVQKVFILLCDDQECKTFSLKGSCPVQSNIKPNIETLFINTFADIRASIALNLSPCFEISKIVRGTEE